MQGFMLCRTRDACMVIHGHTCISHCRASGEEACEIPKPLPVAVVKGATSRPFCFNCNGLPDSVRGPSCQLGFMVRTEQAGQCKALPMASLWRTTANGLCTPRDY